MIPFTQLCFPTVNWGNIVTSSSRTDFKDKIQYYNIPCGFDIETTSFMSSSIDDSGKKVYHKRATMYIWQMSLNGVEVYGRTWSQLKVFVGQLKQNLGLYHRKRLIIYVHNLSFEFMFLLGHFKITDVFARKNRHPISCVLDDCIELKCSYFLSGLSLEKVAENLTTVKIEKLGGNLDYEKIRHYKTVLEPEELDYCALDVRIIYHYIKEEIVKNENNITKIPLTKTGYVRRYVRNKIKEKYNYKVYREKIKEFMAADADLFTTLYKAFAGGYTHANVDYIGITMPDVESIDLTSSYPAQMIMHRYPMTTFKHINILSIEKFLEYIKTSACVFRIKILDLQPKSSHHVLSLSKCEYINNYQVDNGRIVSADCVVTYMTDVDWRTFNMFYKIDTEKIYVDKFYFAKYKYLYKPILESILDLYETKTKLKGVKGKEEEYLVSKGMINSAYGMTVTNPVNDDIIFNDEDYEWKANEPDMSEALLKNLNNGNQFLCYQWGVWVTAWARYELLRCVYEMGDDVLYCDTDSIKFVNYKSHKAFIEKYNKEVQEAMLESASVNGFGTEKLNPKDIKGEHHFLGLWTDEGMYVNFKTLGAKRYAYEKINKKTGELEFHFTVSGLSPRVWFRTYDEETNSYLEEETTSYSDCIKKIKTPTSYIVKHGKFDYFLDQMTIPAEYSRKNTLSYGKEPFTCALTDYQGNTVEVSEIRYIHIAPSDFHMGLATDFIEYLLNLHESEEPHAPRTVRKELAVNFLQTDEGLLDNKRRKFYVQNGIID